MDFVTPALAPALPEIVLLGGVCAVMLVDLFWPGREQVVTFVGSLVVLLLTLWSLSAGEPSPVTTFSGSYVSDALAVVIKAAAVLGVAAIFIYGRDYFRKHGLSRGEFYTLGLFALLGVMILASAGSLLTLYLGLETLSLSLYALVAFNRDSPLASEAAIKYFFLGALSSGMLLYGMSIIYGATGTLDLVQISATVGERLSSGELSTVLGLGLVFLVVGIAFKLGAAPFHMWVPDIYHGAPTPITMYLGTVSKVGALALALRLLVGGLEDLLQQWQQMLVVMSVLSLAIGNVLAIAQTNLKRMLAYSTISHMGFFLLGLLAGTSLGYGAALFYMLTYALTGLGAFGMIILLSHKGFEAEQIDDFAGLGQRSPWYALVMMVIMFSLAGVPPMVGFYAKLAVLQAVVEQGMVWLAVAGVLFSVIGAFYYLRVIKVMYFDAPDSAVIPTGPAEARTLMSLNGLAVLALGIFPGPLLALCNAVF